jgi:hypothetical protein
MAPARLRESCRVAGSTQRINVSPWGSVVSFGASLGPGILRDATLRRLLGHNAALREKGWPAPRAPSAVAKTLHMRETATFEEDPL